VFIEKGVGNAKTFGQLAETLRGNHTWKKLLSVMVRACEHGLKTVCTNPLVCKRFRGEDSGLCEFKSPPYRVMFFECEREHGLIVITHCFKKKRGDTPPNEKKRARRLQATYYEWLDSQNDTT